MLHAFRDDERRRITVTATGVVSSVDLVTFVELQLAGAAWGYAVLHDARMATTDVTAQDLTDVVGHIDDIATVRGRGPVAVVSADERYLTTSQAYAYLLTRAGGRIALFNTMAEASEWLDRQVAEAEHPMSRTTGARLRSNQGSTMSISALSDAELRQHLFDRLAERLEAAAGRDSALTFRQRSPTVFSIGRNGNLLVVDQGEGMRLMRGQIKWTWTPDADAPFTFSVARSVHGQSLQMIPVGPEGDVDAIINHIVQTFLTQTQAT